MLQLLTIAALAAHVLALPTPLKPRGEVKPQVKDVRMIGNVTDPSLSRDSCGSTRINNRAFWTCRDTMVCSEGTCDLPVIVNTGSWSTNTWLGPQIESSGPVGVASLGFNALLQMFGNSDPREPFFPIQEDECLGDGSNPSFCDDGTRWAIWPDSPPMISGTDSAGVTTGYTWIRKAHLNGLTSLNPNPPFTLYKTTYTPNLLDPNALPVATVVQDEFFPSGEIGYGAYGNVVRDGIAYLYGQLADGSTSLAKVPVSSIEDKSAYQYYLSSTNSWTPTAPSLSSTSTAKIPNAGAGGQGTFYHSAYYQSYIWIGQQGMSASADFYLATAPAPEGPWCEPYHIFSGRNGDSPVAGGYSLQAHPALLASDDASEPGIYLTWTQQWNVTTYPETYVTPLVWVDFV